MQNTGTLKRSRRPKIAESGTNGQEVMSLFVSAKCLPFLQEVNYGCFV